MKSYRDDKQILAMALEDGCYQSLTAALKRMDGQQSAIIVGNRIDLVHATPGDAGYSCFDAENPVAMVDLLLKLAPIIGPMDGAALRYNENAPSQQGRAHCSHRNEAAPPRGRRWPAPSGNAGIVSNAEHELSSPIRVVTRNRRCLFSSPVTRNQATPSIVRCSPSPRATRATAPP
ncbi:hypothetical protein Thivi_2638 [Thiocystis violascens DSM 198]|uniref:Uncharacterized protein n=2 Tax=Thiocystis violascens TaxID=73141 RepID=I3YC51_THIV6|nr:hypothetical protein Thivi_2638 [Thiocystis violascens DSM 198]